MRFSPGCECCEFVCPGGPGAVLFWGATATDAKTVFAGFGATVHDSSDWSGTLSDYSLIMFTQAVSDPSWWSEISGGTWVGRLHITGEHDDGAGTWDATINYVNSKSGLHGMTMANDNNFNGSTDPIPQLATPAAHQLTDGVTDLSHSASSSVTGGTSVFTQEFNNDGGVVRPIMQQAKQSGADIDWVVCGDSNHVITWPTENERLLCNLWSKPLP